MNKFLPLVGLLVAPLVGFSQARIVINGTSLVTIVENGGIKAKPIYIDVNNSATNAITTVGTKGWIVSESEFNMVKWDISTTTGAYTVPFGYSSLYSIPLTLTLGAGASAGGSILFSTYHTPNLNSASQPSDVNNMGPIIPANSQPTPIDDSYQVVDRFWIMDASSYGTKPAITQTVFTFLSTASTASEVGGLNVAGIEPLLLAQRYNTTIPTKGSWGDWLGLAGQAGPTGVTNTDKSGPLTAANFYRSWTLSSSNSPLPIEISSFTDICNNGAALVQWTSQSELNNDYYTLKKTTDNVHFETVGTLKGAGTTSMPTNYSITDNNPFPGVSYYLLYQTDIDQTTTLVKTIPFQGCGGPAATTITAFNTSNYIEVQINSIAADEYDMTLTNMLGQTLLNEHHSVVVGSNEIQLSNTLSPGIYILNLKGNMGSLTKKLAIGVK